MNTRKFDKNNYEFNNDKPIGVYLIHGFSNTTYEIKQLAQFLSQNNFHVIANNLPGHGTNIQECNNVKYTDWLNKVTQDVAKLVSTSKEIYIVGCSMGAVLALYLASIFPVNGCIVGGTVLKFKNPFTINFLIPLLHKIVKTSPKPIKNNTSTIYYGYSGYPLSALNEFRKLIKVVMKQLSKITSPLLIIHSKSDRLSIKENVSIVEKNVNSKDKKILIVEKSHHNLFDTNPDQKLIFREILKFITR